MANNQKALERFGFTEPDKCVRMSQCVGCSNNGGRLCKVFGQKPMQYASASSNETCPKRKKAD